MMKQYRALILLMLLLITREVKAQLTLTYPTPPIYTVELPISPLNPTANFTPTVNGQTSTFAGNGSLSSVDGTGTAASFDQPLGAAVDASGNIYIADAGSHVIRKITPAGVVVTIAGTVGLHGATNGQGTAASFYHPVGLAVDAAGNIYVADESNNLIRKITPGGLVSTLAGNGTAGFADGTSGAEFNLPCGVAVDASGNVYVADYNNNAIRKITAAGTVSTIAGNGSVGTTNGTGSNTQAMFNHPFSVSIDGSGNLYVADRLNNMIRKIVLSTNLVSTLAGQTTAGFANSPGTGAKFSAPTAVTVDGLGNVYVADEGNNMIRLVNSSGGVSTLSGTGTAGAVNGVGVSGTATFYYPFAVAVDAFGNLYVGDYMNNLVRKVMTTPYSISPLLPAGLSFATATGIISGTPLVVSPVTAYTVNAYSSSGITSSTFNITVQAASSINPSSAQNYVVTFEPRVSGLTSNAAIISTSNDPTKVQTTVAYFDGLGRPIQTVEVKGSPGKNDFVQPVAYDPYGREVTKYLPYAVLSTAPSDGSYKSTALTDQATFYNPTNSTTLTQQPNGIVNTSFPVAGTNLEPSPLSRPLEQGAPGDNWQLTGTATASSPGHTVKTIYTANNNIKWTTDSVHSMQVALYNVNINANSNLSRTLVPNGYYSANQLDVTVAEDENWKSGRAGTVETYTDKLGHVVLKRNYNYATATSLQVLSTYYVYDDLGNLAFVIPPSAGGDAAATISAATLNNLCYQYRYDTRSRLSQKKLPGKGWEFTVYNSIDQPVATQDSIQRLANNWIISKYDGQGREVLTGIWNNGTNVPQASLQSTLSAITTNLWETPTGGTGDGYSNVSWPTTYVTTTLALNYYDSYANIPSLPGTYNLTTGVSKMTAGLPVGKKTAVLNTPTDMLWDVIYYDDLGRTTTTYNQHYLGGTANTSNYDLTKITYNFTNQPTTTTRQHWNTTSVPLITIANTYIYDHMGRKLKTWEQITNGTTPTTRTLLSQSVYNEIGQLMTKQLNSTDSVNFTQSVSYAYNERDWLLSSTAALLTLQIIYNTGPRPQYNGNISSQSWSSTASTGSFNYFYDQLNRLIRGQSGDNKYIERTISYDLEGNINTLSRVYNGTVIDSLTYAYNSTNQVQSINDKSTDAGTIGYKAGSWAYAYDGNGNMVTDNSKGLTGATGITYNLLNLPKSIAALNTTYTYDASGQKLRRVMGTANTDYIGGIEYDGTSPSAEIISFIQTEEGRAIPNGTSAYTYEYNLSDHLGNARLSFDYFNNAARVDQQDNYLPFGMDISVGTILSPKNEYLYNKKELQEETQEYDYGARFYDPVIGGWNTLDPLAEKNNQWSGYNYVMDNPIKLIDPNGMDSYGMSDEMEKDLYGNNNYQHLNFDGDAGKTPFKSITNDGLMAAAQKSLLGNQSNGYWGTLWENLSDYNFSLNVTEKWDAWLDNPIDLVKDVFTSVKNIVSIQTLVGNPQADMVFVNYLNATPEARAGIDAQIINGTLTGFAEFGPLDEAPGIIGTSINNTLNMGLNGGNGYSFSFQNTNFSFFYGYKEDPGITFFSMKEKVTGGNLLRFDYGLDHNFPDMTLHSHFRFNIGGNIYGSTGQYPIWAPLIYWKYQR